MKIRQGFVSNSSSSSFVIPVSKKFPDVVKLGDYMIDIMINEHMSERDSDNKYYQSYLDRKNNIKDFLKKQENKDFPICFHSCNEDTFIVREDDYFLVQTCNNHKWKLDKDKITIMMKIVQNLLVKKLY